MIVDNADDADLFYGTKEPCDLPATKRLSRFLPQCSNGSILFTTRNKKVGVKFAAKNIVHLEKMTAIEAVELLEARLEGESLDRSGVPELLELLEYTPLAISQAAAYMAENSISISEYLQLYNESEASRIELLSEGFEDPARDFETINPIAATWAISFEQIRKADKFAADLLSFMACLDRQGIPRELLPTTESPAKVTVALGLLKAYSLITGNENNTLFNMHRLVHLATRSWLRTNDEFHFWAHSCLLEVSEKFPEWPGSELDTCALYLPHAQTVLDYGPMSGVVHVTSIDLAIVVALYLKEQGRYDIGEVWARKAEEWTERLPKKDANLSLAALDELACNLWGQGKGEELEAITCKAFDAFKKIKGNEGQSTFALIGIVLTYNLHREHLKNQRRLDECKELSTRVLEQLLDAQSSMHESSFYLNLMSTVYYSLEKYKEACEVGERALELCESGRYEGDLKPCIMEQLIKNNLQQEERHVQATKLGVLLLDMNRERFGQNDLRTFSAMDLLARCYFTQCLYSEAEQTYLSILDLSYRV